MSLALLFPIFTEDEEGCTQQSISLLRLPTKAMILQLASQTGLHNIIIQAQGDNIYVSISSSDWRISS